MVGFELFSRKDRGWSMKKLVLLFVMILTIVWTIPSVLIEEMSPINIENSNTAKYITQNISENIAKNTPPNTGSKKELPGESTGNTTNNGLALEEKGKIYYADDTSLWSMNKDGTGKVKIQEEAYPMNIQSLDDDIYYINQETHGIYKVKQDGSQNIRISSDKAYSLNIYNRRLYFLDRYNQLYITSMSLDGKDKKVIKEVVANDMMVYNNYIYYITREGEIGRIRIDGFNDTMLKTGAIQFDVSDLGLYYTYDPRKIDNPKGLYHLDLGTNMEEQLLEDTPYSFNVYNHMIYYNHPAKLSLYKMELDGSKKKQVIGSNTTQINLAGDYVFYKNLEDSKKIYQVRDDGSNRLALEGRTLVSNIMDLSREARDLSNKELSPKLQRTYDKASEIIDQIIREDMTQYKKIKAIHDYVVSTATYDVEAADKFLNGEDSDANAFMAYGILINQKAVCQGYAEAMQLLLSLAGIESDLVIGDVMDEMGGYNPHMWNIVKLDNQHYMLDATWDDPVGPRDILSHEFFLVSDEKLKETHRWAYDEYPPCYLNRSEE